MIEEKMKILLISISLVVLLSLDSVPRDMDPVIVSPIIGEKLDRVERNYFGLFKQIDGFEEAVFYLNPDSSLMVEIRFQSNSEIRDTIIARYASLKSLQEHINQTILIVMKSGEDSGKGSFASIVTSDSNKISGELIEVSAKSLTIFEYYFKSKEKSQVDSFGFYNADYSDILEVKLIHTTNIAPFIYPIIGAILGVVIAGAIYEPSVNSSTGDIIKDLSNGISENQNEAMVISFTGGLIGGVLGLLLSYEIPLNISSETSFEPPFNEKKIEGLRDNAKVY